jgi:hypothetical protein
MFEKHERNLKLLVVIFGIFLVLIGCRHTVKHGTVLLNDPIGNIHRIHIDGNVNESGTIAFDPNTGPLNLLGDPERITLMSIFREEIEFEQIDVNDQTEKGRKVYRMKGNFPPFIQSNYQFYLVVPKSMKDSYRLIINSGGRNRAITLEQK